MAWFVDEKDFQAFRRKTEDALDDIRRRVDERASDSEEVAKIAAQNAEEAKARAVQHEHDLANILNLVATYRDQAATALDETQQEKGRLEKSLSELNAKLDSANQLIVATTSAKESAEASAKEMLEKVENIRRFLDESVSLPERLERIKEVQVEAKKSGDNISALLNHSISRKEKIDQLHIEIIGQDVVAENGENTHIDGIKDRLEASYAEVSGKLQSMRTDLDSSIRGITQDYADGMNIKQQEFANLLKTSAERVSAIEKELQGLLPGGLAAGLSAAYEKKKDVEVETLNKLNGTFGRAIVGMAAVSMIPFAIDVYLVIGQQKELLQVIKDTPIMVGSILPLYLPILWVGYSANKNAKLSKRLIEEYTHKAVLGNTFSGLSNQIETMPHEGAVRNDLRTKLLYNILQVSAENPGKLITDYNKSDHPLMEALENSTKLADSIRRLSKIPGFSAVAKRMAEKNEEKLKEQDKKVKEGLRVQENMDPTERPDAA